MALFDRLAMRWQTLSKSEIGTDVARPSAVAAGARHINRVEIAERPGARHNWTLVKIEPQPTMAVDYSARNAIAELRGKF
jgi:hypothetical protein